MKYKVLIMLVLMFAGLSLLSCNQLGKTQQVEDTNADEESATEEKWDSIVISYHKYSANYSVTGSMIMYSDGTAKHESNHGYWKYGSFYRGESEFGYINITINGYNIFTNQEVDVDYYITQEKDIIWDSYRDLVAKDKRNGYEITAWDIY